ncbi:MAG: PSD1 and planctomycete cytochrome C domain-containing protein [Planctomycetia bacterium]|nr:PSD1 and planctomycete cytochrome C domain-containing protein [Planctomycetia bacterium]
MSFGRQFVVSALALLFALPATPSAIGAEAKPAATATIAANKPASQPAAVSVAIPAIPATSPAVAPDYDKQIHPFLVAHCIKCHGAAKEESGLRLDSVAAMLKGGYAGPAVVAGQGKTSRLVSAMLGKDDLSVMPPEGPKMKADDVAMITRWIDAGARGSQLAAIASQPNATAKPNDHWAYKPIRVGELPKNANAAWARNPLDRFVLAKLEAAGFAPSPEADRATLIRRLSLDLIGLLPTPAEVEAFVYDNAPDAYEKLVERLLASPHYGERWGRHWLDAARYADSNGYTIDSGRSIWKYRDYVINALNADLPFDKFTIEQIAGDMLPGATQQQLIATGFHRNTLVNEEGGTDKEQFRVEAVIDRVSTVGTVWLGLTVACARCHDHKYDAISQREFYRMFALLNSCEEPMLSFPTEHQAKEEPALLAEIAQVTKRLGDVEASSPGRQRDWEKTLRTQIEKLRTEGDLPEVVGVLDDVSKALTIAEEKRTEVQKTLLADKWRKFDPERRPLDVQLAELNAKHKQLKAKITTTLIVREMAKPRECYIHIRGDFLRKGTNVEPGTLAVLPPLSSEKPQATRLDMARWLVDPKNPLTPRVTVNRIWQQYFGVGLVGTENDFGTQGDRPTHPELLDWLADRFVRGDGSQTGAWSQKGVHRLIVTSATYRQSSAMRPELLERDPYNKLLARQSRIRLEAETIRDAALSASGLLTREVGGPGVYPPQPEGIYAFTQNKKFWPATTGTDRYRRGMYTYFWRSSPYPFLMTFDAPDANAACTRRVRSNTPLQALTLANDPAFVEMAAGTANRILREAPASSDADRIAYAFRVCFAREPKPIEVERLHRYLIAERSAPPVVVVSAAASASKTAAPANPQANVAAVATTVASASAAAKEKPPVDLAAWSAVARVLLNLDEFITRE